MYAFIQDNELLKKDILQDYDTSYKLFKDDVLVGIGALRKSSINMMLFTIEKNHRENGYGKILFNNLCNEAIKLNLKKINVAISKNNIQAIRIIKHKKYVTNSEDNDYVYYTIIL